MNIVDSSGWIEYFADGPQAALYAPHIEATHRLLVPSISITEVYKFVARQQGDRSAVRAAAVMRQASVLPLSADLAILAAKLAHIHKLPLADSIIYASAKAASAVLWTQDDDFKGLPQVRFFEKK